MGINSKTLKLFFSFYNLTFAHKTFFSFFFLVQFSTLMLFLQNLQFNSRLPKHQVYSLSAILMQICASKHWSFGWPNFIQVRQMGSLILGCTEECVGDSTSATGEKQGQKQTFPTLWLTAGMRNFWSVSLFFVQLGAVGFTTIFLSQMYVRPCSQS